VSHLVIDGGVGQDGREDATALPRHADLNVGVEGRGQLGGPLNHQLQARLARRAVGDFHTFQNWCYLSLGVDGVI
jgi:hypothetical protein